MLQSRHFNLISPRPYTWDWFVCFPSSVSGNFLKFFHPLIRCNYLNSPNILTLFLSLVLHSSFKNLQINSEILETSLDIREAKISSFNLSGFYFNMLIWKSFKNFVRMSKPKKTLLFMSFRIQNCFLQYFYSPFFFLLLESAITFLFFFKLK